MTRPWQSALKSVAAELPSARGLLPLAAVLVVWQIVQRGPSPYFPPPSQWWSGMAVLTHNGQLWPACAATIETLVIGLAVAIAVGFVLGLTIGISPAASRALGPLLEFLRAIPPPALVPLVVLLLGYDKRMKLFIVAFSAVWPILLNIVSALRHIDPLVIDVARSFRLSPLDRLRHIIIPSIVPAALIGIKIALPLAIVVTLLVEILTSIEGLGALMIAAQRNFQSGQVYGILVLVGLFGFVMNDILVAIEALVLRRWPPRRSAAES